MHIIYHSINLLQFFKVSYFEFIIILIYYNFLRFHIINQSLISQIINIIKVYSYKST